MKYIEYLNELTADIALLIHRLLYLYFQLRILLFTSVPMMRLNYVCNWSTCQIGKRKR